jgi:hypothetical protein
MKTKTKLLLLLVICLPLVIISCQKEVHFPPIVLNQVPVKKIVHLDTTLTAPNDTIEIAGYRYDSTGRVLYGYLYSKFNPGVFDTSLRIYYTYTGNSTQPDRVVKIQYDLGHIILSYDTSFLSYNSEGYVVKDSAINHDPLSTPVYYSYNYSLSGSDVILTTKTYGPDPNGIGIPSTRVYHQARASNDISTQLDTTGPYRTNYVSVFDQKNNPLYFSIPVHYLVYDPLDYVMDNTNKHLVTDLTWNEKDISSGATQMEHYKYEFQYDKNEQPTIARELDLITNSPKYKKYLFIYK